MINQKTDTLLTERQIAENKYKSARTNLLLMIVLTIVNVILLFTNSNFMILFSATIPYYAIAFALAYKIQAFLIAGIVVAAIFVIIYFACWFFSKKHFGWMIAALVIFSVDTISLVVLYILLEDLSGILDFAFHVLILYHLIIGVKYGYRLYTLPEDENTPLPVEQGDTPLPEDENTPLPVEQGDTPLPVEQENTAEADFKEEI